MSMTPVFSRACLAGTLLASMTSWSTAQTPNAMRPATVAWGGYTGNEQLIGSQGKWDFVARNMDAYLLHGAYWTFAKTDDESYRAALAALGAILKKEGKTAHYETGFGELPNWNPDVPEKRGSYLRAQTDITRMKQWDLAGVTVDKIRVDWFPMAAMGVYAQRYQTTDMRELMARVTGASELFGKVPGFDPTKGHWREYATLLNQAFPGIKLCFDQAPCNHGKVHDPAMRSAVSWPGFGYGYQRPMVLGYNGDRVMVHGQPATLVFDFMDQLMGVKVASAEAKVNYVGFEGDTPFNYIGAKLGSFPGQALPEYLLNIERYLHGQGLRSGRFLNDSGEGYGRGFHASLRVELGKTSRPVDHLRLTWGQVLPVDGLLETSPDGSHWKTLKGLKNEPHAGNVMDFKLKNAVETRFIRFSGRKASRHAPYQLVELEVFGPEEPQVNLALHQKATSDSTLDAEHAAAMAVDGNVQTCWSNQCLPGDTWDQLFHDRSLSYLEYWQSVGGRADDYIVESWREGPFTYFPETKPGSFSNLARDVIRRLRGLDDDGTLLKADLAVRVAGESAFAGEGIYQSRASGAQRLDVTLGQSQKRCWELQIRNDARERVKGDARATPLLRAQATLPAGWTLSFRSSEGKDLTAEALAQGNFDGWFVGGLDPGASKVVYVELSAGPAAQGQATVGLELYWNPQEAHPVVRDAVTLNASLR